MLVVRKDWRHEREKGFLFSLADEQLPKVERVRALVLGGRGLFVREERGDFLLLLNGC